MGSSILIWNESKITHSVLFSLSSWTVRPLALFHHTFPVTYFSKSQAKWSNNRYDLNIFQMLFWSVSQFDNNILLGCEGWFITFAEESSGFSWIQLCSRFSETLDQNHILTAQGYSVTQCKSVNAIHLQCALNLKGCFFRNHCPPLHEEKIKPLQINMQKVTVVLWDPQITVYINFFRRRTQPYSWINKKYRPDTRI